MASKQAPITDTQRRVLEMDRDHPDATPKDILGMLNDPSLNVDYVQRVIHDFDLPEEESIGITQAMPDEQPETETETEDVSHSQYQRDLETAGPKTQAVVETILDNPDADVYEIDQKTNGTSQTVRNAARTMNHLIPDDAAIWDDIQHPEEIGDPEDIRGEKATTVINTITDNPEALAGDIAEMVGCTESYVRTTCQLYTHLLPDEWQKQTADTQARNTQERDAATDQEAEPEEEKGHVVLEVEADKESEPGAKDRQNTSEKLEMDFNDLFNGDGNLKKIDNTDEEDVIEELTTDNDEGAGLGDTLAAFEKHKHETVDPEMVDMLYDEADAHAMSSQSRQDYADGIKRALNVLGLEQSE